MNIKVAAFTVNEKSSNNGRKAHGLDVLGGMSSPISHIYALAGNTELQPIVLPIWPWDRTCFLHTGYGYQMFYPRIENLILPMLFYQGCHERATFSGCIGTHAHGRKVTSLLC